MVMFLRDKVDIKTRSAVGNRGAISNSNGDELQGDLKVLLCVYLVQEQNTRSKIDRSERRNSQIHNCHWIFETMHPSAQL